MQRLAVLYSRLSGYILACFRHLERQYGIDLEIVAWPPAREAPYDIDVGRRGHVHWKTDLTTADIRALLNRFQPDAILMSGWIDRDYLRVARLQRRHGVPVIAGCDTQWVGTLRQQIARCIAPVYLKPAIDILWVPGERQRIFANKLGYAGARCWSGYYACNRTAFARARLRAADKDGGFLYVGRFVSEKGIRDLVDAYARYRSTCRTPWPLTCVGAGALQHLVKGGHGVVDAGFKQPDDLPGLMKRARAFVLPSRQEPWGVALQEAAAAGLPVISTDACGASVHLLQDGYNGYLVETASVAHLSTVMRRMAALSDQHRQRMGDRSFDLSRQFTPKRWAGTLVRGVEALRSNTG